ncbi:hypothetical protein AB1K62_14585 [Parasphingorhabdus sp. JC815]|uniref:hypothetical protein n=1 Tax=Parasphingorhabdus sp. JC815 TaxID=3232140 RepID=UPI00345ABBE2
MPRKKRPKPLYQRGEYRLYERKGRNLEIIYYDQAKRRERSISAGTADIGQGKLALDREYLKSEGRPTCPTCHRPWDGEGPALALDAIADYLLLSEGKAGISSARTRLSHITDYLVATDTATNCAQIDEQWVERFRKWREGKASPSHIEGSVMQLAAAINATNNGPANFKARQFTALSQSPEYRADIKTIAAMFGYAMEYDNRDNLLRYLRAAVATWARPDAIYDIHSDNWKSNARVLALNPAGRLQTKKYRPTVPIAQQFAPHLDVLRGQYLPVTTIKHSWGNMREELGLPKGREAGEKLIRRSIATIARKELGEEHWIQGRIMLGHVKSTTSDIYALPNPAHIGRALAVTESIIDEIDQHCKNAFYRNFTAKQFDFGKYRRLNNG